MDRKNDELISLREAAKISGYSSDYIGQLIRSGKLEGKQVFSNVAWMTTEEAVLAYMEGSKKPVTAHWLDTYLNPAMLSRLYTGMVWFVAGVMVLFILFLSYILAVSVDHRLEMQSLQDAPQVE